MLLIGHMRPHPVLDTAKDRIQEGCPPGTSWNHTPSPEHQPGGGEAWLWKTKTCRPHPWSHYGGSVHAQWEQHQGLPPEQGNLSVPPKATISNQKPHWGVAPDTGLPGTAVSLQGAQGGLRAHIAGKSPCYLWLVALQSLCVALITVFIIKLVKLTRLYEVAT